MRKYFYIAIGLMLVYLVISFSFQPSVIKVVDNKHYFDNGTYAEIYKYKNEVNRYRTFSSKGVLLASGRYIDGEFIGDNNSKRFSNELPYILLFGIIIVYFLVFGLKDLQYLKDLKNRLTSTSFTDLAKEKQLELVYQNFYNKACKKHQNIEIKSITKKSNLYFVNIQCNTCKKEYRIRI